MAKTLVKGKTYDLVCIHDTLQAVGDREHSDIPA